MVVKKEARCDVEGDEYVDCVVFMSGQNEKEAGELEKPNEEMKYAQTVGRVFVDEMGE